MRLTTLHKQDAHDASVWSAAWVPDSSQVLTGSLDETVKSWDDTSDALQFKHTFQGHNLGVVSVAVSNDGQTAAASSLDSTIRVWNMSTHQTMSIIETASTETWSIAFNPQSSRLQLASAAGTRGSLVLWSFTGETEVEAQVEAEYHLPQASDKTKERFVLSVAYSPDGRHLACGAMDGSVVVFDVGTGKPLHTLEGHYKPVRSLTFMPDGKTLLTACDDMHVNLYDAENAALLESFSGHESWVLSVAAHPGGKAFATGGSDAKVRVWDASTRTCVQTLEEHTDQVWSVAFNQEGTRLASASDDKRLVTYSFAA